MAGCGGGLYRQGGIPYHPLPPAVPPPVQALTTHPDTQELDMDQKIRIACTMIYRFGEIETGSVEDNVTLEFSTEQLVAMSAELSAMREKVLLQQRDCVAMGHCIAMPCIAM